MQNKVDHIYFIGDIHGQFEPLVFSLMSKYKITDAVVIVCGDIGIGFCNIKYYIELFGRINKKLQKQNIHLYFIRGNHDDPSYFNNTPEELVKGLTNIHLISDWSILNINEHNILCIGGATSIDKIYRMPGISWWEGESVTEMPEFIFDSGYDIVISHAAPIFCPPVHMRDPGGWMSEEDFERSTSDRKILADIYYKSCEKNIPVKYWFYGHYHDHFESELPNDQVFSEYEKSLLNGGLKNDMVKFDTENKCRFIGLNMSQKNGIDLDLFKLC